MEIYQNKFTVDEHDVGYNGVCRASALMRYMQSAAQNQLTDNGMSYDLLRKRKRAFLLSRIKIEFTSDLFSGEPISAYTFPAESRGYGFMRFYQLMRDGVSVGRAVSVWALIDTDSRSLVRVNDFELGLKTYDALDLTLDRMIVPKSLEEVGKYKVTYADTDRNMHMNNTRYPDMYSEFLPLADKRIAEISINYLKEAPMGDTLTVTRGYFDGVYYFRTLRSDGQINSEARITLTDIKR